MDRKGLRSPKVGLALWTFEGITPDGMPRWSDLKAMAQCAEAVGFDSLWVPDHTLLAHPVVTGGARLAVWECWSVLSALAAATNNIELGTFVACSSFRNPALLAKMADTVDEISNGRLILGLGAGWVEAEFHAFGYPFDNLVSRFEEALQIIHPLLRKGAVDFKGKYYEARDCELLRRGPRPAGPPIMIGAKPDRPRALRLTAQYADYWNVFPCSRPERIAPMREAVDAACQKAGRDPATLQRTSTVLFDLPVAPKGASLASWRNFRTASEPVSGSPQEIAATLRAFARAGVGHVQVWLDPYSLAGIEAFAPVLELLDRD
jgi:alkanesulfonate monooxygenase SsuD/methylene tetrahydromethanopterin reductase-like flavin-dependent oxidoreductase (luciferase family)